MPDLLAKPTVVALVRSGREPEFLCFSGTERAHEGAAALLIKNLRDLGDDAPRATLVERFLERDYAGVIETWWEHEQEAEPEVVLFIETVTLDELSKTVDAARQQALRYVDHGEELLLAQVDTDRPNWREECERIALELRDLERKLEESFWITGVPSDDRLEWTLRAASPTEDPEAFQRLLSEQPTAVQFLTHSRRLLDAYHERSGGLADPTN